MRESRFFVRSSDLQGRKPVRFAGDPAVLSYPQIIERVYALAGPDAAALFAEPVLPRGATDDLPTISWYSTREGAVSEVDTLDEIAQRPLLQALRERIAALGPALDDPEIGPALSTWLNIGSTRDILSVGGEPVLVNWGFLPEALPDDPDARAAHYAKTFGIVAPSVDGPVSAGGSTERPPSAAASVVNRAPAAGSAPRGGGTRYGPPSGPPSGPQNGNPAEDPSRRSWLAPAVAAGLAGLLLLLLLIPGVLLYPSVGDTRQQDAFEADRLKASNDSLETQLKALQDAEGHVCRAPNGELTPLVGPNQSLAVPPAPMELVPRAPDRLNLPPSTGSSTADARTVQDLLEKSTVMVFALQAPSKSSEGSGFFIDDRHIVTNHHVVANMDPALIFVASQAIGGIRHAKIVVKSEPPPDEHDLRLDLAVLEIAPTPGHASLKLGTTPPKLSTAYVAGFPGFLVMHDVNFKNFVTELFASVNQGQVDETLAQKQLAVPGADMRYGRINNIMNTGEHELPVIIHDKQLAPGNSGGPLVDACGRLGGINTMLFKNEATTDAATGQQEGGGGQQANVAQDVGLLKTFLASNQLSFSDDSSSCEPTVARNEPAAGASGGATPSLSPSPSPGAAPNPAPSPAPGPTQGAPSQGGAPNPSGK